METVDIPGAGPLVRKRRGLTSLEPIGGMWRHKDILTFGGEECASLREKGEALFRTLFEKDEGQGHE